MRNNSFTPFSESLIWKIQRNYFSRQGMDAWRKSQVPHYITSNPFIAFSYARIIRAYLRDLSDQTKGEIFDGKDPVYILELGAGSGRFAFYFMRRFFETLDVSPLSRIPVCYVMSDFAEANIEEWRRHPRLQPLVAQGRLDFARFDAENDASLTLINRKVKLSSRSLKTPLIIIANYVFDGLIQDLFFILNKRVSLGGLIVKDKNGEPLSATENSERTNYFEGLEFEYQGRELKGDYYERPLWNRLLNEYAEKVFSATLLFPSKTLLCLENLTQWSRSGYLALAADRGSHLLRRLAVKRKPSLSRHGSFSLPVNFYLTGRFLEEMGATVKQFDRHSKGLNFMIAFDGSQNQEDFWRTNEKIEEYMEDFNPEDFFRLKRSLRSKLSSLTLNQMSAYLRLSRWDHTFFLLFKPELSKHLPKLDLKEKEVWADGVVRMLDSYLDIGESRDLYFEAGNLLADMGLWGRAEKFYKESMDVRGPRGKILFNLAVCSWNLGNAAKSDLYLTAALELEPDNRETGDFLSKARKWRRRSEAFPLNLPSVEAASKKDGFFPGFEALGLKHAINFHRLYQEADIPSLTRLPELPTLREAGEWIKDRTNRSDRLLAAIMHPEYGFAGVICLKLGNDGLVWYWLGKEYRNQGLAAAALICLREAVESQKIIKNLYAAVYKSNSASRRVLKKAGFRRLDLDFKPPHKDMLAYGVIRDGADHIVRINALSGKTVSRTT